MVNNQRERENLPKFWLRLNTARGALLNPTSVENKYGSGAVGDGDDMGGNVNIKDNAKLPIRHRPRGPEA